MVVANSNDLHHIFDNAGHGLDGLVDQYGSQQGAYSAMQQAVRSQIGSTTGVFSGAFNVGGTQITIRGNIINGIPRIGTAFIPQTH
jgi:hypothetical protein